MADNAEKKSGAARGPAYPFISLKKAIERAEEFRLKEGRNTVPATSAFQDWGYTVKSGNARQTMAALKHFGLVEYPATGQIRLSDLALKILLDRQPNSQDRERCIQEAALNPAIHAEIRKKYGADLPSDATLQTFLELERGFNEGGAKELIGEYRDTIRFAKLDQPDKIPPTEADTSQRESEEESDHPPKVGDLVQWESQGSLQFPEPRRVTQVLVDEGFVMVEGASTGIPIDQVIVMTSPQEPVAVSPAPATPEKPSAPNLIVDRFTMKEGVAVFQWPERLSQASYEDLEEWLKLELRKAKRSITD